VSVEGGQRQAREGAAAVTREHRATIRRARRSGLLGLLGVLGLSSLWSLNFSQFVAHTYGLKRCATRHRWRANFGQQGAFPRDASLYL